MRIRGPVAGSVNSPFGEGLKVLLGRVRRELEVVGLERDCRVGAEGLGTRLAMLLGGERGALF